MTDSSFPAANQHKAQLILHANRHMTAVMDNGTAIPIRPPDIGEWQEILAAYAHASEVTRNPDDLRAPFRKQYGYPAREDGEPEPPVYALAFGIVLRICGGTEIEPTKLPMWAGDMELFQTLYNHWRSVEVVAVNAVEDPIEAPPVGYGTVHDNGPVALPPEREGIPVFDIAAAAAEGENRSTIVTPPATGKAGGISASAATAGQARVATTTG